jgi:cytochrome c553
MSYRKLILAALLMCLGWSAGAVSSATNNGPLSPLVWEPTNHVYTAKFGDVAAHFVFKVRNPSDREIVIDDVKTSCGCTVAQFPSKPWHLAPGETNHMEVLVDLRGKFGRLFKQITLLSSNAPTTLNVVIDVPNVADATNGSNSMSPQMANRIWGQQLAALDHQAVFKKECAKCHLEPAFGKYGKNLYDTSCGICHEAEHRATMVPDLHALKTPIETNYWREWITYGKPATLMPGFAATLGGPLDEEQIKSLVVYASTNFPRPLKPEAKADKQQD